MEAIKTTPQQDALALVRRLAGHSEDRSRHWARIVFSPGALQRLGECMGMVLGVALSNEDIASHMAYDLVCNLDRLNTYGGDPDEETPGLYPWRVVLYSDGTLCGFRVQWYRAYTGEQVRSCIDKDDARDLPGVWAKTRELAERYHDENRRLFMKRDFYTKRWNDLYAGQFPVRLNNDVWHKDYALYAFAFNGGLLFHGFGNDPFAVQVGTKRFWSLHT